MQYAELVELMSKFDAQRLTLVVHPNDEPWVREAVRQIGDESLRTAGQLILAPNVLANLMVEPGQILVMPPKEAN